MPIRSENDVIGWTIASRSSSSPLTLSCWYARTDTASGGHMVMSAADSGGADAAAFYADAGSGMQAQMSGGTTALYSSVTDIGTTLRHVAAVFDGVSSRAVYVDGTQQDEQTDTANTFTITRLNLARTGDSTPFGNTSGNIAFYAAWGAALTDAEVASLGDGVSPLLVRTGSLIFYAPLWRNDAASKIDYIGGASIYTDTMLAPTVAQPKQILRGRGSF